MPTKLQKNQIATTLIDGWTPADATWTYASASTITVPSGAASIYQKGDRIKWTQTTVKYGVIVAVADTVLTIAVNTDYTVANAAITANYYSHQANPLGYPGSFTYTVNATSGWTTTVSCTYKYTVLGNVCFIYSDGDFTAGGTSNSATIVVPLPMSCSTSVYGAISAYGRDNGSNVTNIMYAEVTGSAMTFYKGFFQTAFTTSGTKVVFGMQGSARF